MFIKKIMQLIAVACITTSAYANDMILPIVRVVDGDTIRSYLSLPCPLCNVSIRIRGIDTPETTYLAKCQREKDLGNAATEYVKSLTAGALFMNIVEFKWDKYGGRIDAYVEVNGVDIGRALIEKGLAAPYTGSGPKRDWCN